VNTAMRLRGLGGFGSDRPVEGCRAGSISVVNTLRDCGIFPLEHFPVLVYICFAGIGIEWEGGSMALQTRSTDAKGRVSLPKAFANATVIIEQLNENELRIRKARVVPEDEYRFSEEVPIVLSDRGREQFLNALDHPPKPNAALRRLLAGKARRRG
jgi:hypothetical protein